VQTQPLTYLGLRRVLALWGKTNVLKRAIWSRFWLKPLMAGRVVPRAPKTAPGFSGTHSFSQDSRSDAPCLSRVGSSFTQLVFAIFFALLTVPAARATQMFPISIEKLTSKAHVVLHGTVESKSVQRDPEGRIYTRIELAVTEAWKGEVKTNRFTMVQGGGVLGEEVARVSGQEEFLIGEEVVAFLVLNQRGEGVVIGLTQGKFKVAREASGEGFVHNVFHGVAPGRESRGNEKGNAGKLSLGQLKARVQGGAR
jgi:hypothetical protein